MILLVWELVTGKVLPYKEMSVCIGVTKVRFEPGSARFRDFGPCANLEPNLWSGSAQPPNPELRSGSESSGSNFVSEPDSGNPSCGFLDLF
jgi:hypothetical protein